LKNTNLNSVSLVIPGLFAGSAFFIKEGAGILRFLQKIIFLLLIIAIIMIDENFLLEV